MSARPLTDAQISRALRAHLPEQAAAGLRERVHDAARMTTQQRALPSFLGALSEADPVARRRNLLIAAALLVALAVASAAAVGALRMLQRDPVDELSLEPPADLPAFVLSSYERLPQLPPVALTWHDSGSAKGRVYVDRSGAVRFDQFASADATEPSAFQVLSGNRLSGVATVGSDKVWVEDDGAIGGDPRVYLRSVLRADEGPGCEMERDPSESGNGTAAAGWRYIGLEYVAGRPTHHVACVGELWIDIATRLILRTQGPSVDDAGQPIPVEFTEVTEIAFGEQPAALFEPPEGLARWLAADYKAYICARDLPNELAPTISDCPTTGEAEATPLPTPTPVPTVRPSLRPRPSGPAGPLAWTQASLKEDWPAPVRPEPDGGAIVVPILVKTVVYCPGLPSGCDCPGDCGTSTIAGHHVDPPNDIGSDVRPWADIRELEVRPLGLSIVLATDRPMPVVDPTEQWIAYGLVADTDRDGVPDWRYGIDNRPVDATGEWHHRAWRTDLHTGRTESNGDTYLPSGGGLLNFSYPQWRNWVPEERRALDAGLGFGGEVAGGGTAGALPSPFYTWASVIQDGRVVATDYAPDVGWLDPSVTVIEE